MTQPTNQDNKNSQQTTATPNTAGMPTPRTYTSDIAQLLKENKLSEAELGKIDSQVVEDAKKLLASISETNAKKAPIHINKLVKVYIGDDVHEPTGKSRDVKIPQEAPKEIKEEKKVSDKAPEPIKVQETPAPKPEPKVEVVKVEHKVEAVKQEPVKHVEPVKPAPVQTPKPQPTQVVEVKKEEPKPVAAPKLEVKAPEKKFEKLDEQKEMHQVKKVEKKEEPKPAPVVEVKKPEVVVPPKPQISPEQKLQMEEKRLKDALADIQRRKSEFDKKESALRMQENEAREKKQPYIAQEQNVATRENLIREQERDVESSAEKQVLEKKRWALEDERQRIENQRWNIDQLILGFEKEIQEAHQNKLDLIQNEQNTQKQLDSVKKQEIALQAEAEKKTQLGKLEIIKNSRRKLETVWKELIDKKSELAQHKNAVADQVTTVESDIDKLETQESKSSDPVKTHELETARWKKDTELRNLEQEEWLTDEQTAVLQKSIDEVQKKSQEVLHLEKIISEQIGELDKLINAAIIYTIE